MTTPELATLIPRVIPEKHPGARGVQMHRSRRVIVTHEGPYRIPADGEIVGLGMREMAIERPPGEPTVVSSRPS